MHGVTMKFSQESVEQLNDTKFGVCVCVCVCVSLQRNAHADSFLLLITFKFVTEYFNTILEGFSAM